MFDRVVNTLLIREEFASLQCREKVPCGGVLIGNLQPSNQKTGRFVTTNKNDQKQSR